MISELTQRLTKELLQAAPLLNKLIPKHELHVVLQSALAKINLVTREEFDAQSAVLQRTRAKLEALEAHCAELEKAIKDL